MSQIRGYEAERRVFRAFSILNFYLEKKQQKTMFIIQNFCYENMNINFRQRPPPDPTKIAEQIQESEFPNIFVAGGSTIVSCGRKKGRERHECDLIVLHEEKGIIFIQVKAVCSITTDSEKKKLKKGLEQLKFDLDVFNDFMKPDSMQCVTLVLALPNLTKEDNSDVMAEIDKQAKVLFKDNPFPAQVKILFKDNLSATSEKNLEMEMDLREWWGEIPEIEAKPEGPITRSQTQRPSSSGQIQMDKNQMYRIAGCYAGMMSGVSAVTTSNSQSIVREVSEAVTLSGRLFKRVVLTEQQAKIIREQKKSKVFLQGPPGSGKTLVLVFKAIQFLKEAPRRVVVVLDLHRGMNGRAICDMIYDAIKTFDGAPLSKIHVEKISINANNDDNKWITEAQKKYKSNTFLFIIDELPPLKYSETTLKTLVDSFKGCLIWCASDVRLEFKCDINGFKKETLTFIHRCPAFVQNLLYHTDWDADRKKHYTKDLEAERIDDDKVGFQAPGNGPLPVCVRHSAHGKICPLTDCEQCAHDLSDLLLHPDKLCFLKKNASGNSLSIRSSSVVILVALPEKYHKKPEGTSQFWEIDSENYEICMEHIKICRFILKLTELLSNQVKILSNLQHVEGIKNMYKTIKDESKDVLVTWLDRFQGLEGDVIIFLPAEAFTYQELVPERKDTSHEPSPVSPGTQLEAISLGESSSPHLPAPGLSEPADLTSTRIKIKGFASSYWENADIKRYTEWDQHNLFMAASRCSSQLICLVP